MRAIFVAVGPDGMRRTGCCRCPSDLLRMLGAPRSAAAFSLLVDGVPSPPGCASRAYRCQGHFVSSPMLLLIIDWMANREQNQAAGVQKAIKKMRQDVERASR